MKLLIAICLVLSINTLVPAKATAQASGYRIDRTFHIASAGGWDYLAVNGNKLYVSHGTQVNILDKTSGDSIGIIPNTTGVHGIAFIPAKGKGYTSNGKLNNITVFDLTNGAVLSQIPTGQNPDAILYDSHVDRIITCNGRSNDLTVVDPSTEKTVATIPVGGKPETAVSDGAGKLFVNIEDKNEIVVINLHTNTVQGRWPLAPAEGPTGLAYDAVKKRLFAGCDKLLVVMDAISGRIIDKITIGDGCDGVAYDADRNMIFTSNGEGTMSVIKEKSANSYEVVENMKTKKGARTITIDNSTHILYLPTADYGPAVQGQRPPMIPGTFQVLVVMKSEKS
ncbi:MAG: YncE family protein [Chitinophagaceae bacterium]|nr:YncE family protein [Chitinophagaceae bacterium]